MTANKKLFLVSTVSFTVLLNIATASAYVEELDDRFKNTRRADEIWLIEFYAPWCTFCQQLDPVWYEIGAELKSMGSPISVGKVDADVHRSLAKEFRVTDYPAIKLWKDDLKYNYRGPRTKEAIMDFADRVSGPVVRALPSQQLFQNVMSRHDVLFVYVGGTSDLKEKYFSAAKELIVHTYFFSATRHILPKAVTLEEYPAVVVFKEGTYFLYNEQQDGELVSWINRERFLSYLTFDSYTLYAMGDTGKVVVMAVLDEKKPTKDSIRYKTLMQRAATEYKDFYSREFQFGHMDGNLYINGIIMDELAMPAIIALNMSNDGYFLPPNKVETMEQLVKFLDAVSKGRIRLQGGNGYLQRIKRMVFNTRTTVTTILTEAPLLGALLFFVFGFVGSTFCFVLYKSCEMVRSRMREEREEAEALQSPGRDKNTETRKNPSEKKAD
ncbi:protein disulfide-isomerase TMX3 [Esox lucius]|uniref:protein disulfide-isomerase n=1 Tax=Esox lucius TaxID=8010 RepID=A0A3P8YNR2_ESOLU|nr:protein disulfide-isomerase TMX3 [Esox lucius]